MPTILWLTPGPCRKLHLVADEHGVTVTHYGTMTLAFSPAAARKLAERLVAAADAAETLGCKSGATVELDDGEIIDMPGEFAERQPP